MRTPLAALNLWHYKMRTAAAVAGVTFSVVLVFLQLGFLGSVDETARLLYSELEFDLLIRSSQYIHVAAARSFPRQRLAMAASQPGVRQAVPFFLGAGPWHRPGTDQKRRILILGMRPGDRVLTSRQTQARAALLVAPEFALIDRKSRREFGPKDGRAFGEADVGTEAEVGGRVVRIVGHYSMGGRFAADGGILVSERGFRRLQPGFGDEQVSLGLIRLEPGADADRVAAQLRGVLPPDVEVATRQGAVRKELVRWIRETPVGVIFRFGVGVALIVGIAIVYQVLSSDVANHLAEYATLKAMGYSGRYVAGVVLCQAVILALLAYLAGFLLSDALYRVTAYAANIPIGMTLERAVAVFVLTVGMCMLSGLGAVRKLRSADPADLF